MAIFLFLLINVIKIETPTIIYYPDSVVFTFHKDGNLSYTKELKRGIFRLKLKDALISPPWTLKIKSDIILGLEIFSKDNSLFLDFKLSSFAHRYRIREDRDRLIITFIGKKNSILEPQTQKKQEEEIKERTFPSEIPVQKKELRIKRIVIDPGHGGKDAGAVGYRGTMEKDINLQVAKILKEELEEENVEVFLTREEDVFIKLSERTKMANDLGADLFISLHCNASKRRGSQGVEVYFLSEAKTDWERAVASLENASLKYEIPNYEQREKDIIELILLDMAQAEFLKESSQLAEILQESLIEIDRTENRGMKQAGFYVLNGAYMPAVLIELGFITNPDEEKRLKNKKYQKKLARNIVKGIIEFKKWYERKE